MGGAHVRDRHEVRECAARVSTPGETVYSADGRLTWSSPISIHWAASAQGKVRPVGDTIDFTGKVDALPPPDKSAGARSIPSGGVSWRRPLRGSASPPQARRLANEQAAWSSTRIKIGAALSPATPAAAGAGCDPAAWIRAGATGRALQAARLDARPGQDHAHVAKTGANAGAAARRASRRHRPELPCRCRSNAKRRQQLLFSR